jgi:intracellular multiplication protein IcmV
MALKDIFKVSTKTFVNPSGWLGFNEVKNNTNVIWSILRSLVVPATSTRSETFSQAMKRLKVSDEEVETRKETYINYTLFFLTLAVMLVAYSFYLAIVHRTVAGFALGIVCAGLFLTQAFKFHFWYTQIKLRKLGLTYEDWLKTITGGDQGPAA